MSSAGACDGLKAAGVAEALEMAIARRRPGACLLHHSDRGVQYICYLFEAQDS